MSLRPLYSCKPLLIPAGVTLSLPIEYQDLPEHDCQQVYGLEYLTNLRDSRQPYCTHVTNTGSSSLHCFHSNITSKRNDAFCVAESVSWNASSDKRFKIQCELRDSSGLKGAPTLDEFPKYMYDTGPKFILDHFFQIEDDFRKGRDTATCPVGKENGYKILVKREGEGNPWHSLLEIFSLYLTLDILSITPRARPENLEALETLSESYYSATRAKESQVVILDDRADGPFFELWSLLTGRPTLRLAQLPADDCEQNILLPLPGGSNPLWFSDWSPQSCKISTLIKAFSKRILGHYGISTLLQKGRPITITIINRQETRRLQDIHQYTELLRQEYQDSNIRVELVDFAAMGFKEQLEKVTKTDVLVGVHGAGMVHTMFMEPNSAVVEIFPPRLEYPVYRNLAKLKGVNYFSTHATKAGVSVDQGEDWHSSDLEMREEHFLEVISLAVKSVFNRGILNIDV